MIGPSISALPFRCPAPGDAPRLLDLPARRDLQQVGHPGSILEDLHYDWDHTSQEKPCHTLF